MDQLIELMKEINIGQLIAIGVMFWFFYSRLDGKIEKTNLKIAESEKSIGERIDKLGDKVEDIDRRLCRIEGSLATQGHCLFHKQQEEKRAE